MLLFALVELVPAVLLSAPPADGRWRAATTSLLTLGALGVSAQDPIRKACFATSGDLFAVAPAATSVGHV
jgi:hypothetical protein